MSVREFISSILEESRNITRVSNLDTNKAFPTLYLCPKSLQPDQNNEKKVENMLNKSNCITSTKRELLLDNNPHEITPQLTSLSKRHN